MAAARYDLGIPAEEFLKMTMRHAAAIWRRWKLAHGITDSPDQAPPGFWPTNTEEQQRAALCMHSSVRNKIARP